MRIVTLDSRMLQPSTLEKIENVPHFGNDRCENGKGWKSNMYNFENQVCILSDLCYPDLRWHQLLSVKLQKLSNIIAIYEQPSEMFWVVKNRHTGREGWFTRCEFEVLMMKEGELA